MFKETKPTFLKNEMLKCKDLMINALKFISSQYSQGLTPDKQIRFMILNNLAQKNTYLKK